jgi:3-hydroxybutyryl-CoA dehydrogenase
MSARSKVAVIGAGLMGHGIAQVFAVHDHTVTIFDANPKVLETVRSRIQTNLRNLGVDASALDRLTACPVLEQAVAGARFVVEAAPEDLKLKRQLFKAIEAAASPQAILASNTSVIPITQIVAELADRTRCLGTHWWNPPFLVPLVEVIETEWTSREVVDRTIALHTAIGKTAVHVKRDVAGFVGNRLQHALWREAIALVEQGVCDAQTVDAVVKASFGRRLAVLGRLENADLVGTDLTLAIHKIVLESIDSRPYPSPYLEKLVADGCLGMKSGRGFRNWNTAEIAALQTRLIRHLRDAQLHDAAENPASAPE